MLDAFRVLIHSSHMPKTRCLRTINEAEKSDYYATGLRSVSALHDKSVMGEFSYCEDSL